MSDLRSAFFLRIFRTTFMQNVTFLLAITLAAAFYAYESSSSLMDLIPQASLIISVLAVVAWIWISFTSGFMRRRWFVVFGLVYWLLPQFIIIRFQDIPIYEYSTALHISSRVSGLLVRAPLNGVSDLADINAFIAGLFLVFACAVAFLLGYIFRDKCQNRQWYRVFRERYEI
jgi:hypothetical protein